MTTGTTTMETIEELWMQLSPGERTAAKALALAATIEFGRPAYYTMRVALYEAIKAILYLKQHQIRNGDWECPECEYDSEESGGLPNPGYCPLCFVDGGGRLVAVRSKGLVN